MDLSALNPISLVVSIMIAATPLLFAAIGELVTEKSGVLNLGVEGMMIFGAICGFAVAVETGSPMLGVVAAAFGGAALSLIFGVLTQYFLSNQVATGLGLTLFGLGLSALIGQPYAGIKPPDFPALDIDGFTAQTLSIDPLIPLSILLVLLVWLFLTYSRAGLTLRAIGENHDAAHSLGYNVIAIRMAAIGFGGACAGIGGAYLSLIRVPQWTEGMTAGAGWIALAIVVFAGWRPWLAVIGAYVFGGVTILQLNIQALDVDPFMAFGMALIALAILFAIAYGIAQSLKKSSDSFLVGGVLVLVIGAICLLISFFTDWALQSQYLSMTPYLVTIVVLVIMSADKTRTSLNAPASLGRVFQKSG